MEPFLFNKETNRQHTYTYNLSIENEDQDELSIILTYLTSVFVGHYVNETDISNYKYCIQIETITQIQTVYQTTGHT